jgi:hypothetical protein
VQWEEVKALWAIVKKLEEELLELKKPNSVNVFGREEEKLEAIDKERKKYEGKLKELQRFEAISRELKGLESRLVHCRFIGECFVGQQMVLPRPQKYNPSRSTGIIVAVH